MTGNHAKKIRSRDEEPRDELSRVEMASWDIHEEFDIKKEKSEDYCKHLVELIRVEITTWIIQEP
jgi:hypothetical protein